MLIGVTPKKLFIGQVLLLLLGVLCGGVVVTCVLGCLLVCVQYACSVPAEVQGVWAGAGGAVSVPDALPHSTLAVLQLSPMRPIAVCVCAALHQQRSTLHLPQRER